MKSWSRILFGAAGLALFGLLLWRPWRGVPPPLEGAGSLPQALSREGSSPGRPLQGAVPSRGQKRTRLAPSPEGEGERARSCRVAGRLLFQGRPVVGAAVEWRLLVAGAPIRTPSAARTRTGKDGRFLLRVPPRSEGFLRAQAEGLPLFTGPRTTALGPGGFLPLGDLSFPRPFTLQVQVLDRSEGTPLPGASIRVLPPKEAPTLLDPPLEGRTDAQGRARMGPLGEGTWRILVRAEGFSPYQQGFSLPREDETAPLTLYLARGPGLQGRVVDERGTPLPGALVTFRPFLQGEEDHRAGGALETDKKGNFLVQGLEEGDWSLQARAPGRAMPRPLQVTCPPRKPLVLVLHPLPGLSGRVLSPPGVPPGVLAKGKAALTRKGGFAGAWVLSPLARPAGLDRKGRFRISLDRFPPPETKWIVVAWAPGLPPGTSKEFFFEKGKGPEDLRIRLPRPGQVRGRLSPLPGARVVLEPSSFLPFPPFLPFQKEITALPGPGGTFLLGPIAPGKRRIRFSAPGRVPLERQVQVISGKTLDLGSVSLLPGVAVGGILLGPSGRPEPGGLVWLRPLSGGSPRKTTAGPGGRFRFPPVPPGKYLIQGCRRDAGPVTALRDYAASRRLLVLSGREYRLKKPISLEKRR